jgi:uncharacterized lipoprotein YmbA
MLKTIHMLFSVLTLGSLLLLLSACGGTSKVSRFYVLSPMDTMAPEQQTIFYSGSTSITIGPVSLPKYLKKQQIVTRSGSNELQLAEFDRWAGKIEEDIGRVVAENLAQLLSSDRVFSYQASDTFDAADYTVEMAITRFDGSLGGSVQLDASWAILDVQKNMVKGITASHIIEPISGATYGDMVAAQSRALALLSRELGFAFKDLLAR